MTSQPGTKAIAASTLLTVAGEALPRRGPGLAAAEIRDGVLAMAAGRVAYAGPAEGWEGPVDERLEGVAIVPGFVDCHTHLPFFGWRDDEFEARVGGRSYRDLHGEGGGIGRSARLLAGASDDEVLGFCRPLAAEMLAHGTTAFEMKTGYGLSVEAELRQARLARRLAAEIPQTVRVTLLACHAVPDGMARDQWVTRACDELIPQAAAEGLVDAVDVYVEDIAFTVEDLERVAEVTRDHGLLLRCHADQLGPSGATEAAVRLGARGADHLNHVSADGVAALGGGSTAAVLLPASSAFIGATPPPVPDLLAAGAAPAIGTDFNPGTSPTLSMPEAISAASVQYRIPPLAVLTCATANAAWVLGLDGELGTLEPGKRADFLVLDAEAFRMVPYRPGHNPVQRVYVAGERVV